MHGQNHIKLFLLSLTLQIDFFPAPQILILKILLRCWTIRERLWMQRFLKRRRKRSTNTTIIINIRSMLLQRNLKGLYKDVKLTLKLLCLINYLSYFIRCYWNNYSLPSGAEVKNERSHIFAFPYAFMLWKGTTFPWQKFVSVIDTLL